jgi:succinyl-CoA synthetase beta subunit
MQLSGLKYGATLLDLVGFPHPEFLTGSATNAEIRRLIDTHGRIVVKPVFHEAVGKKGKAGLVRVVDNLHDALTAKRELFFATHRTGSREVRANGVTFEAFVESDAEVYFAITESTRERKPAFTISPFGGTEVEELPPEKRRTVWIDPFIGLKSFDVTNALRELGCPAELISPLVQHLPAMWELYEDYGLTTIELNPVRLHRDTGSGRLVPYACDVKAAFDQDDPAHHRTGLNDSIFRLDESPFEDEINRLRTYRGQSDAIEMNTRGTILPFMFGGGASSAATETLGSRAIFSSDFGGNPPYEKMYDIARIAFRHHLDKANVLLVIGGKANNTDIYVTFRGMFDALRDHAAEQGVPDVYVVVGRGGPNLVRGMAYARDILDAMGLPYTMFGHDTSMIQTLEHACRVDDWWSTRRAVKRSRTAATTTR